MTPWCVSRRISPRAIRWSTARAISAISTAIIRPPTVTPKRGMTDVARLLLEGIDEDGVEFRPNYTTARQRAGGVARRLPEPARQRLAGHRGRHGDLDSAAQRGRALRRRAASDREARGQVEGAAEMGQGPGFPDRRHHRRFQGSRSRRPMSPAAARSAPARNGSRKRARAAPGSWSSPKFRGWCRSRGWSRRSPSS